MREECQMSQTTRLCQADLQSSTGQSITECMHDPLRQSRPGMPYSELQLAHPVTACIRYLSTPQIQSLPSTSAGIRRSEKSLPCSPGIGWQVQREQKVFELQEGPHLRRHIAADQATCATERSTIPET